MTTIVALVLGWWIDHMSQSREQANLILALALGADREAAADAKLEQAELGAAALEANLRSIREIRQFLYWLDPHDPEQAEIIGDLLGTGLGIHVGEYFRGEDQFKRIPMRVNEDVSLEVVILHDAGGFVTPNHKNSLVLLFKEDSSASSLGSRDMIFVDALKRHTGGYTRDGDHTVAYEDRDGDDMEEVVFDYQGGLAGPAGPPEMFRPTPQGFVNLTPEATRARTGLEGGSFGAP